MALTDRAPEVTASNTRQPGPDVVRGAALIGVVIMNYLGYSLIENGQRAWGDDAVADFFDPWRGPLSTRFAATFVLVAGVGVAFLTRRARDSAGPDWQQVGVNTSLIRQTQRRLLRRGALLFAVGLLVDKVWPGTILTYYGAMFMLAAGIFMLSSRHIAIIGGAAAAAGWIIEIWINWRLEQAQTTLWLTAPDTYSPEWFVLNTFVNGTHPLLPWLAYLCAGILLGRAMIDDSGDRAWRRRAARFGAALFVGATAVRRVVGAVVDLDDHRLLRGAVSTHPFDRGAVYVASALGTALLAYCAFDWLAQHTPRVTMPLRRAGQLSLTLYLLHIVAYEVPRRADWFLPSSFGEALTFALVFWVAGIALGAAWQARFGRGPAERVYRWVGG